MTADGSAKAANGGGLLTGAQMRRIEQAAIDSGAVTGNVLMERAGAGVARAILDRFPAAGRALLVCGPGNNGGDGYVVARHLCAAGWDVSLYPVGTATKTPVEAATARARWLASGAVEPAGPPEEAAFTGDPVVVDALFGTGLSRAPAGEALAAIQAMHRHAAPGRLVAVDILSGLCADSGRDLTGRLADAAPAGLTVTFHRARVGHWLDLGARISGEVLVCNIGLSGEGEGPVPILAAPAAGLLKQGTGHKYTSGHALILAGPPGRGGAARLAARGALRIGAGLVTLGCEPAAMAENAARLDAVMLRRVAHAGELGILLGDRRIVALCLGPGLGLGGRMRAMLARALADGRPLVLDADALTLVAGDPALFAALHAGCILTPHGGEFARLFPDIAARLAAPPRVGPAFSKLDAAREAAARAGAIVLFKGAVSVIAAPDGRAAISSACGARAAPWLATAGSGDVLVGLIGGLLARGFPPFQAAATAVWLHVEAALDFGPGLIAEDLPEQLPEVLARLSARPE